MTIHCARVETFTTCILAWFTYHCAQCEPGSSAKFAMVTGKRYNVSTCALWVPSAAACATTCLRDDGCTLTSHNAEFRQCEMANTSTTELVQDAAGWNVYHKTACPSGWARFGYSCYYLDRTMLTQQDAKMFCSNMSAHLVNIKTEETYTFLQDYLTSEAASEGIWAGGEYNPATAQFHWTDSSPFADYFDPWYTDEPNGLGQGQYCLVMYPVIGYKWASYVCKGPAYSLCEMKY